MSVRDVLYLPTGTVPSVSDRDAGAHEYRATPRSLSAGRVPADDSGSSRDSTGVRTPGPADGSPAETEAATAVPGDAEVVRPGKIQL